MALVAMAASTAVAILHNFNPGQRSQWLFARCHAVLHNYLGLLTPLIELADVTD